MIVVILKTATDYFDSLKKEKGDAEIANEIRKRYKFSSKGYAAIRKLHLGKGWEKMWVEPGEDIQANRMILYKSFFWVITKKKNEYPVIQNLNYPTDK